MFYKRTGMPPALARWWNRPPGLLTLGIGLCSSAAKKSFVPKRRAKPATLTTSTPTPSLSESDRPEPAKTYLAMARAVKALLEGEVTRLILTRPAVEAGETLGFLPGTLTDKIDPYLRPLYDALREMLDTGTISRMMSDGTIEVAALAYMRGRTLNGSFIILDEAQNTTSEQMKMFLTRLGFGSKMVVTGDITQIDLPSRQPSGLKQVSEILGDVPDIAFSYLSAADVVRHSLVGEIINAYDSYESQTVSRRPQSYGRE